MLVVKLEVWPGGEEAAAYEIGRAEIANVSELEPVSNYWCTVTEDGKTAPTFTTYRHRRADGPWRLVQMVVDRYLARNR